MKQIAVLAGSAFMLLGSVPCAAQRVEFNRDIRPILSDKCFTCHGPDKSNRLSPLRFDTEGGAFVELKGGRHAIVRSDPAESEMFRRIATENKALRMPPAYAGHPRLSDREIELVRRWIEQGAEWQPHWSFITPKRPPLPEVKNRAWPRNAIDHFVLSRLENEGITPSPEADRTTLIRRVSLDLTGIPPTPAEVNTFVADHAPDAYERLVDRLLASPRYGERMALEWLDGARYADTNGYQTDAERFMWRWRDWVIEAFNRNMPFDQFTVEQIAGDMLPEPTLDQFIATGFNRNHRGNGEGGIVPEEYAVEYVADRVETTSTVWLGLTMGCARCHDHKYDPITQKEFYRMFAYFNNVPERGRAFKYGNSPPVMKAPTSEQQKKLALLDRTVADVDRQYRALQPRIRVAQKAWEKSIAGASLDWAITDGLLAHYGLDEPENVAGRTGRAAEFDGKRHIVLGDTGNFGFADRFTLAAWIFPTAADGAILGRTQDDPEGTQGYAVHLKSGKIQVNLVQRWLDDALRVETLNPLELHRWHHVAVTYDGTLLASGLKIYLDGKQAELNVLLDELNQSFAVAKPLLLGAVDGSAERFHGRIDEVRIYKFALPDDQIAVLATPETAGQIAAIPGERRTKPQADKLGLCFLSRHADDEIRATWKRLEELRAERGRLWDSIPTVMVMKESAAPRKTHLLTRGAYDQPGEEVQPGLPSVLPPLPEKLPNNRLGFAKWLVEPSNPLTARVALNRFWQMLFGTGIVKTAENFGSQGEWPSHPELLDWLSTEFASRWDVKAIVKTIVTSATYRQSSRPTPELLEKDPENRLLARGPRLRLRVETVRDQALAASGLLVERVGGPSVKPYQPPGIWTELAGGKDYQHDHGPNLYRRSLYTFWKRTAPPPAMMTFDATSRETCYVLANRTNTPLQALNLMNDTAYVEASRKLAERMMREGRVSPPDRIDYGFRLVTARAPVPAETEVLVNGFHRYLDRFRTDSRQALALASQGESPRDQTLDIAELGAYTMVAGLILNLDEAVTKE